MSKHRLRHITLTSGLLACVATLLLFLVAKPGGDKPQAPDQAPEMQRQNAATDQPAPQDLQARLGSWVF